MERRVTVTALKDDEVFGIALKEGDMEMTGDLVLSIQQKRKSIKSDA